MEWLCCELNCIEIQLSRYGSYGLTPIPNKIFTYNTIKICGTTHVIKVPDETVASVPNSKI